MKGIAFRFNEVERWQSGRQNCLEQFCTALAASHEMRSESQDAIHNVHAVSAHIK